MTDRIYPASKPNSNPPQTLNGNGNPSFPATKAQLYGATRPVYRPQPKSRRHRRSCCCLCCLWSTLLIIALVFLAAIAAGVVWLLYHPQRPTFSVSTVRISRFNLTTSKDTTSHLNSQLDLAISTRNPNKKIVFLYDPITVTVSSTGVDVGNGSFPSFTHGTKNTTTLKTSISSSGAADLDAASATSLKSDLKRKNGLPLEIQLETKVKVKMGSLKTKKVGVRVTCDGIDVAAPKGKTPSSLSPSSDPKCKVDLRFKIWKWTF
ncbi:PREDICTED: protein YLS9-like [Nelumbo nucifera]|uniref:Protein YLS9-like n=1 Tax=Nelumbo nucifera TaxID=4432 RepID=A0A1U8AJ67_NELNU|nr:PREDICTED: protein YLS9-like [Nelumbo nucifera]